MNLALVKPEDSSPQKPPSSEPICPYAACDGSGIIHNEKEGYQYAKNCQCLKDKSKMLFLGERFYGVKLQDIAPRNPKQERLKASLLRAPGTSVFLYGRGGQGKTHFLAAMFNYWHVTNKKLKYLEDSTLKDELRNAELNSDYSFVCDTVRDYDCIFLDDMGKAAMTPFHQSALYRFFNEAYKQKRYLFITANDTLKDLGADEYWGAHVARRIEDLCEVVEF